MILIFLTDKWKEHAYQTLFSISHFLNLLFLPPYTLTYQYQYSPHSPLFIFFDTDKENLFNILTASLAGNRYLYSHHRSWLMREGIRIFFFSLLAVFRSVFQFWAKKLWFFSVSVYGSWRIFCFSAFVFWFS